jgi:hypothetical protein
LSLLTDLAYIFGWHSRHIPLALHPDRTACPSAGG